MGGWVAQKPEETRGGGRDVSSIADERRTRADGRMERPVRAVRTLPPDRSHSSRRQSARSDDLNQSASDSNRTSESSTYVIGAPESRKGAIVNEDPLGGSRVKIESVE